MIATDYRTRTVNGTTYHQDPADAEMWYTDPAHFGREGLARWTGELDDIRAYRNRVAAQVAATADDAEWLAEAVEELADYNAEIALLTALAG